MNGRGLLEVILASFTKGPCCFPFVRLMAGYVVALETVDNPTILFFRVLVLFYCVVFEMYLYTILTTCVLETFHLTFCIRYNHLSYC